MCEWIPESREKKFPNLNRSVYHKTSEEDEFHNCIAYAAGDKTQWWQPPLQEGIEEPGQYWPPGAPIEPHINSLIRAYELSGFQLCPDDTFEEGFEKVALYAYPDGGIAHAAKRLANGKWSSKLGDWEDIMHDTYSSLEGTETEPAYGSVKFFMKKDQTNA